MITSEARKRKEADDDAGGTRGVANDPVVSGIVGPDPAVVRQESVYSNYQGPQAKAGWTPPRMSPEGEVRPLSEEVRVTATSGGQKGSKPERFDLIPTDALRMLARHYGKGNAKYPAVNGLDNWRNGYPLSLSYAAMQRHLHEFWQGEDYDEETGSLHLVAAAWHCFTMIHFLNNPSFPAEYDDRQDMLDRKMGQ